jgi:hypothetical protein
VVVLEDMLALKATRQIDLAHEHVARVSVAVVIAIVRTAVIASAEITFTVVVAGMLPGTTYYWKIVAHNVNGSATGPVWSFTTPAVTALTPLTGATGIGETPTLSWSPAGESYDNVYFGTSPTPIASGNYIGTVANPGGANPTGSVAPGTLAPLTTYYWQIDTFSGGGHLASAIFSFTTLDPSAMTFVIGGVDRSAVTIIEQTAITQNANGTPSTAALAVRDFTPRPTVGMAVSISQGSTVVFSGEVIGCALVQEAALVQPRWRLECQDFTFAANKRLVTKAWDTVSASSIAADIVSSFAPGFTVGQLQGGLPATSFGCVFETVSAALTRLAQRVGASWKWIGNDLYFRGTSTLGNPADLTLSNTTWHDLQHEIGIDSVFTRVIVGGGGTLGGSATVVAPGALAGAPIPLSQAAGFAPSGYALITFPIPGSYPAITRTLFVSYSAVYNGGLIAAPTSYPVWVSAVSGAGNHTTGLFYYAQSFVTSAGETGIGPIGSAFISTFPPGYTTTGTVTLDLITPADPSVTRSTSTGPSRAA